MSRTTSSRVLIKAQLGGDMRKFRLDLVYDLDADFVALRSNLQHMFQLGDDFLVKYKDDEDLVSIVTVEDFKECINETIETAATLYVVIEKKPKDTERTLSITSTQTSIEGSFISTTTDSATGDSAMLDKEEITAVITVLPNLIELDDDEATDLVEVMADADVTSSSTTVVVVEDVTPASEPVAEAAGKEEAAGTDVEEALRFVRKVHERFGGDDRAQSFLKIGADYHDKKISRDVFHEACLGLFAEDDDLMDSFLTAFKDEVEDMASTTLNLDAPAPQQQDQQSVKAPAPVEVELADQEEVTTEENQATEEKATKEDCPTDAEEAANVSSAAFLVNELHYARLLVQTRLQSLFWSTRKQIQRDTAPAMVELKEFVRNDIIRAAQMETHRRLEEARQASAEMPPAEDVVAAVVDGLQEANKMALEVTKEVTASVRAAVREIMHSAEMAPSGSSASSVSESPSADAVAAGTAGAAAAEERATFSIGTAAREAAAVVDDGSAAAEEPSEPQPALEVEESTLPAAPAPEASRGEEAGNNCVADELSSDSFVMVGTSGEGEDQEGVLEGDDGSSISLVMPEPDVDGVSLTDPAPPSATAELSYHQKAAMVSSSKVIDNLFILYDMGFTDFDGNLAVLNVYENNLEKTVAQLCEQQEARP